MTTTANIPPAALTVSGITAKDKVYDATTIATLNTAGATLFTLVFAASGTLPVFTLAWIANRLSQSIGWSALVKVSSKWFHYSRYGTVAAFLPSPFGGESPYLDPGQVLVGVV